MVKTQKYEIIKPITDDWDVFGQVLRDVQYETWKTLNQTIQMLWDYDALGLKFKEKTGTYPTSSDLQEWCGYKGIDGYIYNVLKDLHPISLTSNLTQTIQASKKRWKTDKKDVFTGKKSIPSFRKTTPIMLHPNNIHMPYKTDKGYGIDIGLISKTKAKELERKNGVFSIAILAKDNSSKAILDRIISGEYTKKGSKIMRDRNKPKWYLLLSYDFEPIENDLEDENVMGIDLGVVIPFYIAFNNSPARYHVGGGEIESFRRGIEARRKSMLRQSKWCGNGRRGHGRSKRMEPTELLADKIGNFKDSANHKYSRYIIDMALKHKCRTIQMEDLTGITSESNRFLKNWTYFDLQTKIEYKAAENGIHVIKINPYKTSQRCSACGYIARENRETQSEFICQSCGVVENADYNAAKNIATVGIEQIIQDTMQDQKIGQLKLL